MVVTDFDGTQYSAVVDNLYPREEKPFVVVKFRDNAGNERILEFYWEGDPPAFAWKEGESGIAGENTPQLALP